MYDFLGFPFNPTYELPYCVRKRAYFQEITLRLREQGCWSIAFFALVGDVLFTFSGAFTGRKYEQRCEQFADYECAFTFCERAFSFDSAGLRAPECEQNVNRKKIDILRFFLLPRILPFSPKDFAKVLVGICPTVLYVAASDVNDIVPQFSFGKR